MDRSQVTIHPREGFVEEAEQVGRQAVTVDLPHQGGREGQQGWSDWAVY
jgi:hypothetical protein